VLVSVIIPTFNRARILGRAMESVLAQSQGDLELIVVDDGSTDGTADLLSTIGDRRVRTLRQENMGVSGARNAGLAAARGVLLALLDSDDHWHPEKLARQVRFMREGGWAVCQTEEVWVRNGRRVNQGRRHAKPCGWFFERSLELCLISPSCVMLTREAWERCGPFDTRLPACEDFHLWLKVTSQMAVGLLPERLTIKTGGHADQLSRRIIGLDLYRIYGLLDVLLRWPLSVEQRRQCLSALTARARLYSQGCLKRGRQAEAERIRVLVAAAHDHCALSA
jgi:glycosyltransferase involved in cell wall biosynthesis